MSCIVTLLSLGGNSQVVRRGTEPRKPVTWNASAWFALESGEKYTHSATVHNQTVLGLVPFMGALIDSLVEDHGNEVVSAGWTATSHGKRKRK